MIGPRRDRRARIDTYCSAASCRPRLSPSLEPVGLALQLLGRPQFSTAHLRHTADMVGRRLHVSRLHRESRLPVHAYCGNSPPTIPAVNISKYRRELRPATKLVSEKGRRPLFPIN